MPNPTLDGRLDFERPADPAEVGFSAAGVERMRAAFQRMLDDGLHPGAQWLVARHGRVVLDLSAGQAELSRRLPVQPDTPFQAFSVTKSLTAVCVHQLIEQGKLELDAPIAAYWPDFGVKGKQTATVRHILLHQAGIPVRGMRRHLLFWPNWRQVTRAVADLAAEYPPGAHTAYHIVNYGFILGELIRRVSGLPVQTYMRRHLFEPLAMKDSALGLPPEWRGRAAGVYSGHQEQAGAVFLFNLPLIRASVVPAATLQTTARDLAVFYQMLVNGGQYAGRRLLQPATIEIATRKYFEGIDGQIGRPLRWGMGFHLGGQPPPDGPQDRSFGVGATERTFGHAGQGSCIGWCDPPRGLVFAFMSNRLLHVNAALQRWQALADSVWEALLDA